MPETDLFQFPANISARFTPDDLEFLNGNSEQLFGDVNKVLNPRQAILSIAEKALSRKQVIEKKVNDPEQNQKITELNEQLREWNHIKNSFRNFFIVGKKYGLCNDYKEMFEAWLKALHHPKVNCWKLSQEDMDYIKTVDHD